MEFCLAQPCPQGNHEATSSTFNTFQPMNLTQGRCQNLSCGSRPSMQVMKEQGVQLSPRTNHTVVSASAPGTAWVLGNADRAEEVPGKGDLSLQAETRAWVQKTQAHWLLLKTAPLWFHGFITRREAERLLQPQPLGCYLVRFSESAVTFVLSYSLVGEEMASLTQSGPSRSQTCCRHFLLAQLGDGRHVVLGEDSAHAQLQDLLEHYTECPLSPYGEILTQPLARQTSQASRPRPPIPAKPQLPPEVYTSPASRLHQAPPINPIYQEPDEPIAFYAMGRGSPGDAPSNIYAEVEGPSGTAPIGHPILRKCWSRPISRGQVREVQGKISSRSRAERGSPS
ncbi:SH2 domain-containing protein 2A isoform X3 [Mus musculus]|uniref:SH2 domain-containing protein 2A isoform X3 n=1 Tax=Mus musculus TaxID=10090 RepID=UPI0007EDA35A|nr:SH2 domain-containing protein 2A isoform X3 [Mus musculus]|eukprot:XP_017175095.1 PREDICTED: SH2 domain-containing protein 2A isoform X3 [Mus musculus]